MQGKPSIKTPGWPTLLILGLLCLRGLVPAGFMLAPVEGHLAVVLCSLEEPPGAGTAGAMPGAAMPTGLHHHHPQMVHDHAAHQHGPHADPTCPYAQSAGPAPLPTLPVLVGITPSERPRLPAAITQTWLGFGPLRQPSSRGPPPHV